MGCAVIQRDGQWYPEPGRDFMGGHKAARELRREQVGDVVLVLAEVPLSDRSEYQIAYLRGDGALLCASGLGTEGYGAANERFDKCVRAEVRRVWEVA